MKLIAQKSGDSSAAFADDITSMDGAKRIGLGLLTLVFGVFGLWAATAPLDGAAFGAGTVTVKSYKKIVQHLEGGIVADIFVRNGDLVQAGDPLLVLDDTQSLAQLEIANSQLIALLAREARLIAERDDLTQVTYPRSLNSADSRVRAEIAAQNEIFEARKTANDGRIRILEQRIEQLRSQITGMQAQLETAMAAHFAQIDHQKSMLASASPLLPPHCSRCASLCPLLGPSQREGVRVHRQMGQSYP